jgi:hypothetical protein
LRYLTSEAGANGFREWLISHGYKNVMYPQPISLDNKKFHYLLKTEKETFYCLFKHDFFYTFPMKYSKFFDKYPNLNSAGESINFNKLILASENDYTLIFIYEEGTFYEIKPIEILKVHELAREFYPNGFIRAQDKENNYIQEGSKVCFKERTISFPVKALSRRLN